MNKNKIIFSILWGILLILVIFLVTTLNSSTKKGTTTKKVGDISIWIYGDSQQKFQDFITWFKNDTGKYKNKTITVESFSDYETYKNTLASAFIKWTWPDIFVLNNNEKSILENQVMGIDPKFISPNDFRKSYKGVFWDNLIEIAEDDSTVEFLKWIPMWYETLWVFYNRRFFKSSDFKSWTALNSSLDKILSKRVDIVPLGMGNGWVAYATDIMMNIFISLWGDSLIDTSSNIIKQWFQTYLSFGKRKWENAYNKIASPYSLETNIDYFSRGDVVSIIGYPRVLAEIEKKWYKKNFLLATPFPKFISWKQKALINYNYFVVNKETKSMSMINDILAYMVSEKWMKAYLKLFPYYLPSLVDIEEDILEKKINPNFNIVYKDFINRDVVLSSFNTGNRSMFEKSIIPILNLEENNDTIFEKIKDKIICSTNKSQNFTNLSSSCE